MGDLNGRIGNMKVSSIIGTHGEQTINRNGKRLIDYATYNNFKITNILFPHKECHKYTWSARNSQSIVDYVITNSKLFNFVLDTRVFRSFELETDNFLLVSTCRFPPKWLKTRKSKEMLK